MQPYIINVNVVEELQMIKNTQELDSIFRKAKSTIVNGEKVLLVRSYPDGRSERFDVMTSEDELATYKKSVYKYL